MKCSEKCARRDWSERVHYISIKDRALRHTSALLRYNARNYVIGTSARISRYIYKRNKKLVPQELLSYISTWGFLSTLEKYEKHSARGSPHLSRVIKTSRVFI